jgi:hypothetical protein
MKRLSGMDAMLLYSETPNLHTHTLKVAIVHATDFDGEFNFEVFRQTIARRLHLSIRRACGLPESTTVGTAMAPATAKT